MHKASTFILKAQKFRFHDDFNFKYYIRDPVYLLKKALENWPCFTGGGLKVTFIERFIKVLK